MEEEDPDKAGDAAEGEKKDGAAEGKKKPEEAGKSK